MTRTGMVTTMNLWLAMPGRSAFVSKAVIWLWLGIHYGSGVMDMVRYGIGRRMVTFTLENGSLE